MPQCGEHFGGCHGQPPPRSLCCVDSRFRADAESPADRINPDGSVTRRNLGRKDNEFSSLDVRLSRPFNLGVLTLEPAVDVFNVFNSKNLRRPEVTNLIFNFDGTVQSGVGDPRQVQLALRAIW